jgi:cellulose synthase operon protein YhjU
MSVWLWTFYFAVKLWLHFTGVIRIHFWPNLVLLALAMPFSAAPKTAPRWWRVLRQVAAIVLGVCLLWYDSYLLPFSDSLRFAISNMGVLSGGFLLEFAHGYSATPLFLVVLILFVGLFLFAVKKRLHPTPFVFLALLIVFIQAEREPTREVANATARFYTRENGRFVAFPKALSSPPFDIVILQICSLSWDDLEVAGQAHPRLLEAFNILFTDFNSATSYSTPAALRLLRAPCGQVEHGGLYDPWPSNCDLIDQLRGAGYRTYAALNFPSGYYGMSEDLTRLARLDIPISVADLPEQMLSFDNQPVFKNGPALQRWLTARQKDGATRAMLFYNTISLHGGGHENKPGGWKVPRVAFYNKALDELGEDVQSFETDLADDGHSAVVIIVPEHGAALSGSAIEAADLRDIPLPRITKVPVAVRFLGPLFAGAPHGLLIKRPSSYLALAKMLSDLLADPSLASDKTRLQKMLENLPQTDFMSETQRWKVFRFSGRYYLFGKDKTWTLLPAEREAATGG